MANNNVTIKFDVDGKKAETGIDKVRSTLNKMNQQLKKSSVVGFSKSFNQLSLTLGFATKAIKSAAAAVKELTDAYKVQATAETQLETAAKNSPYLNSTSVSRLKEYASGLQKISTVGDETLIPMMAELAAAGRTENEIQQIMAAALDASASGAISLDAAVKGLNMSYSGQLGTLGRTLPMLKGLTAEELKQGKAVEVVAKSYNGMAKDLAEATGSAEQLKNAWGDFKETLGKPIESAVAPFRRFLTWAVEKATEVVTKLNTVGNEYDETKKTNKAIKNGTADPEQIQMEIDKAQKVADGQKAGLLKSLQSRQKQLADAEEKLRFARTKQDVQYYQEQVDGIKKQIEDVNREISNVYSQVNKLKSEKYSAEYRKRKNAEAAASAEKEKEQQEALNAATEKYNKIIEKRDAALKNLELEAEIKGETVDAQSRLNVEMSAYLEMATDPLLATRTKEQKNLVSKLADEIERAAKSAEYIKQSQLVEENAKADFLKLSEPTDGRTEREKIGDQIKELEDAYSQYLAVVGDSCEKQYEAERRLKDRLLELWRDYNKARAEEDEQAWRDRIDKVESVASMINSIMDKTTGAISTFANIAKETAENDAKAETARVEKEYSDGLISLEEYNDRKAEIENEAAQRSYKAQMWAWSAQLVQAQANIALSAIQVLADSTITSTVAKMAMMGAVAAAGSAQFASAIASKPVPPQKFASGGYVGGSSYSGDRVPILANSGELVLNAKEQQVIRSLLADRESRGGGMNVTIHNSASNIVNAKPKTNGGDIEIYIDERVNKGLQSGKYNKSLTMANQGMSGDFWAI